MAASYTWDVNIFDRYSVAMAGMGRMVVFAGARFTNHPLRFVLAVAATITDGFEEVDVAVDATDTVDLKALPDLFIFGMGK